MDLFINVSTVVVLIGVIIVAIIEHKKKRINQ